MACGNPHAAPDYSIIRRRPWPPGRGLTGPVASVEDRSPKQDHGIEERQMIGYVTLGTNNIERAAAFYDALLGELGARRLMDFGTFILWGKPGAPSLALTKPYDGKPATIGNGAMVALAVDGKAKVDALYAKAISLGATDEGKPGARSDNFYAGYFRDPDGNKLNFFFMG